MSGNQFNGTLPSINIVGSAGESQESGGCSGVGQSSGGDDVDGEEQEESSSSHVLNVEDALTTFRQQWQHKLETSPWHELKSVSSCNTIVNGGVEESDLGIENEAKRLFVKGVENEQSGKLYEAIQFYRRAVQLVPDIEFRLYDTSKLKPRERREIGNSEDNSEVNPDQEVNCGSDDDDGGGGDEEEEDTDLLSCLQRLFSHSMCVCTPHHEQKATHISALPMEIILYILRWVVSSDLDLRSLEMCSYVCRGFYLCSRDPEIWRLSCARVWGVNCGGLTHYESWRKMFIERPRLQFNGCYISKTTYVRNGENSFQDQFYRPWHIVEYYRYLRFFPEGLVLMLTTPDDPASSLGQLRYRISKNPAVLSGNYHLLEDRVVLVLRRQDSTVKMAVNNRYRGRRREGTQDLGEQTFHLELQIVTYRNRIHAQLVWQRYSIFTKFRSGQETTTVFDLPGNRYPPYWFSRVKSYTAESENPL
ncbi:F-box only protein 9 [Zootermopsis nevadensis]|uniref:F-box only protein 9 n=1 Tax=Zootermopsis nevadensis TaxID=136037 RepID=A0A067QSD7_ZOONE|nr:F-box only protein 9 [Zootermopsis nevadensis]XP_021939755.1 F-box only protein 9 [Zootermopsis nevadensis]KDR08236.1 F-box only protein 9 [Zootermopsis nevadensis]